MRLSMAFYWVEDGCRLGQKPVSRKTPAGHLLKWLTYTPHKVRIEGTGTLTPGPSPFSSCIKGERGGIW